MQEKAYNRIGFPLSGDNETQNSDILKVQSEPEQGKLGGSKTVGRF